MSLGLAGTWDGLGSIAAPPPPEADPVGYIRDTWDNFVNLPFIDLQHRAALARQAYLEQGNAIKAELARDAIVQLGELNKLHGRTVDRILELGQWIGLGAPGTVGVIPPAALAAITALALLVAYLIARWGALLTVVEKLEDGSITTEDLQAARDYVEPDTDILGAAVDVSKLLLWGFLGFVLLELVRSPAFGRLRSNPHLVEFRNNPPERRHPIGVNTYALAYQHDEDHSPYVHNFGADVRVYGLEDGSVLLEHVDGRPLWDDF